MSINNKLRHVRHGHGAHSVERESCISHNIDLVDFHLYIEQFKDMSNFNFNYKLIHEGANGGKNKISSFRTW